MVANNENIQNQPEQPDNGQPSLETQSSGYDEKPREGAVPESEQPEDMFEGIYDSDQELAPEQEEVPEEDSGTSKDSSKEVEEQTNGGEGGGVDPDSVAIPKTQDTMRKLANNLSSFYEKADTSGAAHLLTEYWNQARSSEEEIQLNRKRAA